MLIEYKIRVVVDETMRNRPPCDAIRDCITGGLTHTLKMMKDNRELDTYMVSVLAKEGHVYADL